MKYLHIATLLLLSIVVNSTILSSLTCSVNATEKEITTNTPFLVSLQYNNSEKELNEVTLDCGDGLETQVTCDYNIETKNGNCKGTCSYENGGIYNINGRIPSGECGRVSVEVLEINEQNFSDNVYLDFLSDSSSAQINIIKIVSTPALVRENKVQTINITTRNRVEVTNTKCSAQNGKATCSCELIESQTTRTEISCKFKPLIQSSYFLKFTTRDKKEKTFTVSLNTGQAAAIYASQTGPDFTIISIITAVIIIIALVAYFGLKKLEEQTTTKDKLLTRKHEVLHEIENLKKSNYNDELSDEDLELILTEKNSELEELEKQIRIEEGKLT